MLPLVMLYLAGIALGIAGIVFMTESTSSYLSNEIAERTSMNGYICLSIGSIFFLTATVISLMARTPKPVA